MEAILKVEGISKTYIAGSVEVPALKKCDLVFEKGEFVAIIGKSGSGKSTLLRILGTMDKPDGGVVEIDGQNVLNMTDKELSAFRRQKIGYVYQDYSLFPEFTAYENIIMPLVLDKKDADKAEVEELMEKLGITHCRDKFPSQMSGGEQQRVAIARAIITHPAVIFADEPTGNLDAAGAENVVEMLSLASESYNQTIIMVTHDLQMAEHADRILTIVDGNVTQ
ncbi:MAG: ABC transporter ATP-binding protein [Lachnospira sp.]|nr:ABC transporter ATP-binding protein [Lachnospira sp.]